MRRRLATIPLVLLAACSARSTPETAPEPAAPVVVLFAPGSTSYLLASHSTQAQEFGGQTQTTSAIIRAHVTSNLEPDSDGLAVTFVVDSVLEAQGQGIFSSQAASLAGTTITTSMTRNGRTIGALSTEAQNSLAQQIANAVRFFYPTLPEEGVGAGATWVDTTEATVPTGQVDLNLVAIGTFTAGEWEAGESGMRLPITLDQTSTVSGSGEQSGAQFTFSGTGTSHGMLYVGADGRYLGAASADTIRADVDVPAAGLLIPVTIIQADTVRVVR